MGGAGQLGFSILAAGLVHGRKWKRIRVRDVGTRVDSNGGGGNLEATRDHPLIKPKAPIDGYKMEIRTICTIKQ